MEIVELRKDWVRVSTAKKLLLNGPVDWLKDDQVETLCKILNSAERNIIDILSTKELEEFNKRM